MELKEVDAPSDPLDAYADVAANRFEQDLLMWQNGIRTDRAKRRFTRYSS